MVRTPSLLLLDEPFAALDAITRARLDDELPELVAGAATLMVTHDVAEALLVADRVLMLGGEGAISLEVPGSVTSHPLSAVPHSSHPTVPLGKRASSRP